jgi:dipeptidyl-peptidase-4
MEDQIAVTRKLVETYSFMDKTRTGIWGWSYGGFATLMTLEQDVAPDPVFSCGISGSILLSRAFLYCPHTLICYFVNPLIR